MSMLAIHTLGEGGFNTWWRDVWLRAEPASHNGSESDAMFMWIWWFCVIWFVFLMGLMVIFVAKYRRKPGQIAPRSASHNTPLEIAWTVIPTLFLVYIFFRGFWGFIDKLIAPGNAVEMSMTGYKWNWELIYPNGEESTATVILGSRPIPVFYLPAQTPVKFRLNSRDVMHAFFVPDFRVKTDVLPNRYTTAWFETKAIAPDAPRHPASLAEFDAAKAKAASEGRMYTGADFIPELAGKQYQDHYLFCAEYCGTEHSEMAAVIRIVDRAVWDEWLKAIAGNVPPVELGKKMFASKGCSQCHSIDGSKHTGPTWKNMFGHPVEFTDGTSYTAEQMSDVAFFSEYIRESIKTPAAKIVKDYPNSMTLFDLTEKQMNGVIQYIISLSDKAPPPEATPAGDQPAPKPGEPAPAAAPSEKQ